MSDKQQLTEWLINVDLCRRMAERSNDPALRARWLTLAQQWMELYETAPEVQTDREGFETHVRDKGNGRQGSTSTH